MQPLNTVFEQHAVVSSWEPPSPPDKSPGSQQRPLLVSCPAASIPEPRRDPALCPCPLGWQSCNTSNPIAHRDVAPCVGLTEACRGHRIQSVRQLLLTLLKQRRHPEGPGPLQWWTARQSISAFCLLVLWVLSKRQSSLYLLHFKGYPKHCYWLPVFWQGGPHKTNGPRNYLGIQHQGGECVWLLCHKPIGNS